MDAGHQLEKIAQFGPQRQVGIQALDVQVDLLDLEEDPDLVRRLVTASPCTKGVTASHVEPRAGIEPATPSLPWNHREPLCEPPFPQVTPDRRGQS
jgi:hypothetical protein